MEAPPNSLSSSLASSYSLISGSRTTIPTDELQMLQEPPPMEQFISEMDVQESEIEESIFPPSIFRRHLLIVKDVHKAMEKLQEILKQQADATTSLVRKPSNEKQEAMLDKGSKSNLLTIEDLSSYVHQTLTIEPKEDLDPSKRIRLNEMISKPMITHSGKYLFCLNVALPVLSHVEDMFILNTIVEDNYFSAKAVRLEILCNSKDAELFAHQLKYPYLNNMEPGSIVVVRDPTLTDSVSEVQGKKTLCIRAGNAEDVQFLPPQALKLLLGVKEEKLESENGFKQTTRTNESAGKRVGSLWESLAIERKNTADSWHQFGNECSVRRLHTHAYFAYSIAIRFDPDSMELAASRSASLLSLGFFKAAMNDVDFIASRDPYNTGYVLRKANCFWGQGKHEEAIQYLRDILTKFLHESASKRDKKNREDERSMYELKRKSMFIQRLIVKTEDIIEKRELKEWHGSDKYFRNSTNKLFFDEPEYYKPVRVTYEERDNFKSRKIVVAQHDVKAGNLLVVSKALSVVFLNDSNKSLVDAKEELMNATIQKVMLDRPTKASIYRFSCHEEGTGKKCCEETEECSEFSKDDVRSLCESYLYSCSTPQESISVTNSGTTAVGLWPFLRNIRHTCVGGCAVWYICGNFLFVRAIRDIRKDEEITLAHIEPTESYANRTKFLEQRGIHCICPLCQFEKSEPEHTKTKRVGLLQEMHLMSTLTFSDWSQDINVHRLRKWQFHLEDLTVLRSAFAKLNFPIVEPLVIYGQQMMKMMKFEEAIGAFEKAFFVVDNTAAIYLQIVLSLYLSYCYMAKKKNRDKVRAKKWFGAMKTYAMLLYGCLDPIKCHFKSEFEYLESKGVSHLK